MSYALVLLIASQTINPPSGRGDVDAVLGDVAAAYASALDYHAIVETNVTSIAGNREETRCWYEIAGSRPKSLFADEVVVSPLHYHVRLGTDGSSVWAYSPSLKLYVEDGVHGQPTGVLRDLTRLQYRFFSRFEELKALVGCAAIEGRDMLRIRGERHLVPCVRVRLSPPGADWTEELWIEELRSLVRKSVFRKREFLGMTTTTTLWRSINTTSHGTAEFLFTPPTDARRTSDITVY